ncbi:MAG: putative ABC transporter ATP-binding protein [Candidatus Ozemobacter sibiricus]|uniref:Putative ABC transporter ATP-binding protein n=1 Tax=Candidatus Ozemobacter sibiricus TaxID=2268124 RepID=A0A367ZRS4_9BACT|nr:MAG: putative ABC transporter ATP-binding protein [Candidatus Ozemobacter sibiricus]
MRDLRKRFGRREALAGLQFSVPEGAVAGFLGPNGAGKTTTLRLLLGLAPADAGEMEILGVGMPAHRTAVLEQVGALVEKPSFLDHFSGFDNLWWFGSLNRPVTRERVMEVLARTGLAEAAGQAFGTYSTGMKQRLGVAYAILHRPRLLILDEPTNGMDPQGRVQMRDLLREIHAAEGATIFLSSHLLDEVQRLCDYVVIVDHGRTVREGYVADILQRGRETWEVRVADGQAERAAALLPSLPGVLACRPGPRGFEISLEPGRSGLVNQALIGAGLTVTALIPKEASLEETFLALTDNGGDPA